MSEEFNLALKEKITAKCLSVVDGDTVDFAFKHPLIRGLFWYRCRLKDIDAPDKEEDGIEKWSESKTYLASLIENKKVKLRLYDFDDFGRILVIVYIKNYSVNRNLVKFNYATKSKR